MLLRREATPSIARRINLSRIARLMRKKRRVGKLERKRSRLRLKMRNGECRVQREEEALKFKARTRRKDRVSSMEGEFSLRHSDKRQILLLMERVFNKQTLDKMQVLFKKQTKEDKTRAEFKREQWDQMGVPFQPQKLGQMQRVFNKKGELVLKNLLKESKEPQIEKEFNKFSS